MVAKRQQPLPTAKAMSVGSSGETNHALSHALDLVKTLVKGQEQ